MHRTLTKPTPLRDWRAKRAGGRITVYGKTALGEDVKVVGVDVIEVADDMSVSHVLARTKDGLTFELRLI